MKIPFEWKAMPSIGQFHSSDGASTIDTTWESLCWAAITVGKRNASDIFNYGIYSWFELVYRTHMVWANLQADASDHFMQTNPYKVLDRSEKGAISYFFGMAVAKLLASEQLNVPWLVHMGAFSDGEYFSPDLIGRTRSRRGISPEWVVLEAKGRTNGMTTDLKGNAIDQAKRALRLVHRGSRIVPSARIASISYFSKKRLRVYWEDPEEDQDENELEIKVDEDRVTRTYYGPLAALITSQRFSREQRILLQRDFTVAKIEEIDLEIGLDTQVIKQVQDASNSSSSSILFGDEAPWPDKRTDQTGGSVYPDGVVVRLGQSWSQESMRQEPQQR